MLRFLIAFIIPAVTLGTAIQQPFLNGNSPDGLSPELEKLERALPQLPDGQPRIRANEPVAKVCYSFDENGTIKKNVEQCKLVLENKTGDAFMTNFSGSYFWGNWATCQRTGKACAVPLGDKSTVSDSSVCHRGSIPDYYIDVHDAEDIKTVFAHAKTLSMPLVIKNTGHDWKGRSSGPGALSLWMHNLQHPRTDIKLITDFVPEGCEQTNDGKDNVFHFGAGEQWRAIYDFAHIQKLAVLGGTCPTVGVAGWLQGGGHSPMSPSLGLGVDNVRQLRVITPKGEDLIVNRCRHPELFKAIKGGGGGTWGVILEIWYKAVPKAKLNEFTLHLAGLDNTLMREFFEILTEHAVDWAARGWGGYIQTTRQSRTVALVNTKLSRDEAVVDMESLVKFATKSGTQYVSATHDSWYDYFGQSYGKPDAHRSSSGGAVASRLVPPTVFKSGDNDNSGGKNNTRAQLVDILLDLHYSRINLWIMPVTPSAFPPSQVQPSVLHPTWRTATWLIRVNDIWDPYNEAATPKATQDNFRRVHHALDKLRRLTPGMGVSINEADIWEPDHELSFWGDENHKELQQTKKRYDPDRILAVMQGVDVSPLDPRFRCYPRQDDF